MIKAKLEQTIIDRVILDISRREGKTAAEVRTDMQAAIQAGFHSADPMVQVQWASIPRKGEIPTPEELMIWAIGKIMK